jgi:DNA-binding SARP family transcriptional activator/tetratricopeptide (TPR) repeat protein
VAPTLHIRLLGNFRMINGEEPVVGINTPRLQSLLAYLILHRDAPHLRQRLAFLYWPDSSETQARNNLRQLLHGLRLALPFFDAALYVDAQVVQWRPDASISLDIADFEQALTLADEAKKQADTTAWRAALENAISHYSADLLPSCYDDWITPEREHLRQRHLHALDELIQLLDDLQEDAAAIGYTRLLIRHDALNEEGYRRLMRLLARKGDRASAMRVYHACTAALQRELGVMPSPETHAAYERLLRMEGIVTQDRDHGHALAGALSLTGRQREWERLGDAWKQASVGKAGFALISGEAGVGKSRLADDVARWARQQGATTAKTRCYAAEGRLSLAPVTEWLRSEGIRRHLGRLDPLWLAEVARVLPELTSEYPDLPPSLPIGEYGQRQRFFEALARAICAAPSPLLLLIDDLQWCDEETLEWLHFLLRFAPDAPLLLIGTARTEEITAEHSLHSLLRHLGHITEIVEVPLQPLDAAETAKLASQFAHRPLDVETAMRLFHETEGNPLFVVETMRAGFTTRAPSDPSTMPPRMQAVIAGRLAQLSPGAREVVALAATIGRAFRYDVLARAGTVDEDAAVRALDELWQKRIVREQGMNTYDFTHDKLREVAYMELSAAQRRLLHRRIAQALEAIYQNDLDPVSGQLASHYDRAGMIEQAISYYRQAAAVAQRVYANDEAITALSRGLELLAQLPGGIERDQKELGLQLALAPLYRVTRGWTAPELERVIHRTLTLCDTVGDDMQRADALYGYQSLLVVQANLADVERLSEELREIYARQQRQPPLLSGMMVAGVRLHQGHFAEAFEACEQMIAAQDPASPGALVDTQGWDHATHTRAWQSHALWCLGYPERALSRGQEAIQLASDLELPFNQALATTYFSLLQQLCAPPAEALEQAEEAWSLTVEFKAPYYRAWAGILRDYGHAQHSPDAQHLARLRLSIERFKASGARLRLPYYLWLLAQVCCQAGEVGDGLTVVQEALEESQATGERWWDSELYRLRSELLQRRGSPGDEREIESCLWQALEIARSRQARSLELRAATSLARLWQRRARADAARRTLRDVYDWFTEGFKTPDLRTARSLLAELT